MALVIYLGGNNALFGNPFCHEIMRVAQEAMLNIVGVMETDPRYGPADFAHEKQCCPAEWESNLRLLDQVCFLESRSLEHEVVQEVVRQGLSPVGGAH